MYNCTFKPKALCRAFGSEELHKLRTSNDKLVILRVVRHGAAVELTPHAAHLNLNKSYNMYKHVHVRSVSTYLHVLYTMYVQMYTVHCVSALNDNQYVP